MSKPTQGLDEPTLSSVPEEQLLMKLTVYLSFYVEARDDKSVEGMSKFIYKILGMITEAYADGFKAASKGAFSTQQALKKDYKDHINQQIKSVLDSIPEPTITDVFPSKPYDGTKTYEDMLQVVKYYKSTIQKIRSRYE